MDLYQKISILGPSAQYDTCGPKDFGDTTDIPGVYRAKLSGNRTCRLFKVLQSNFCVNNCTYCAFRRDRNTKRAETSADEMAKAFYSAYSRRLVEGFFLSSGVSGTTAKTMTKMLDTAAILRKRYGYSGYIHLKIMPKTTADIIRESLKLANRISLNIESPTESGLSRLSPDKNLRKDIFYTLSLIKSELKKLKFSGILGRRNPSITTQFVVGAADEKDTEIVQSAYFLYKNFGLKRIFYSAFRPVVQTPLENKPMASLIREHRLYQTDFLLRFYHFPIQSIPFDTNGFLEESSDPKMIWAKKNPHIFPINLNSANYWDLLKIPGIGPCTAKKITNLRKISKIKSLNQFKNMRIQTNKMKPFVCF